MKIWHRLSFGEKEDEQNVVNGKAVRVHGAAGLVKTSNVNSLRRLQ
jgi:ribosomal protein L35AE/L33A